MERPEVTNNNSRIGQESCDAAEGSFQLTIDALSSPTSAASTNCESKKSKTTSKKAKTQKVQKYM